MLHCLLSYVGDSECFARTCLTIREQGNDSFLEKRWEKRFNLILVDMRWSFLVPVGVIEHKLVVLDVLCNTVNFYLGLVHLNARVEATYCVDFALAYLLFEKGPFTHTYTNVHLVWANVIQRLPDERPLFLDHLIIVKVANFACRFVGSPLFFLFSFHLFELPAPIFSLLLKLLDIVNDVVRWFCYWLFLLNLT